MEKKKKVFMREEEKVCLGGRERQTETERERYRQTDGKWQIDREIESKKFLRERSMMRGIVYNI
jgi:hypothetical protein